MVSGTRSVTVETSEIGKIPEVFGSIAGTTYLWVSCGGLMVLMIPTVLIVNSFIPELQCSAVVLAVDFMLWFSVSSGYG